MPIIPLFKDAIPAIPINYLPLQFLGLSNSMRLLMSKVESEVGPEDQNWE